MAIEIIGKNKEEIRAAFDKYNYLKNTVELKTVGCNGNKKVVRLSYHYETWSNRSDKNVTRWYTYWLLMTDDRCVGTMGTKATALKKIGTGATNCTRPIRKTDPVAMARMEQTRKEEFAGDKGNCVLLAVTNVTGLPYETVRNAAIKRGYNPRRGGMFRASTYAMLDDLGIKHEDCTEVIRSHGRTLKTLDRKNIKGTFLIHVKGHCTSMINGTVLDYGWDRARPVHKVTRILI